MQRKIYLMFTDFKELPDLSFLNEKKISAEVYVKGSLMSNGRTIQPYHSADLCLNQEELPDDYDDRIEALISAVGGEEVVKDLVSRYQARIAAIVLGIPCRTSEWIEEGYLSHKTMQKLGDMKLDIQFYYI